MLYCVTITAFYDSVAVYESGRGAKYCNHLSVCLFVFFVSLPTHISQKPHVQILPNFLCMLPVAVARSSSEDSAIFYVLPVLWMTLFYHIMELIGQNQRRHMFHPVRQVAAPVGHQATLFGELCHLAAPGAKSAFSVVYMFILLITQSCCIFYGAAIPLGM